MLDELLKILCKICGKNWEEMYEEFSGGAGKNILGISLDKTGDAVLQSNKTNRINRLIKQKYTAAECRGGK